MTHKLSADATMQLIRALDDAIRELGTIPLMILGPAGHHIAVGRAVGSIRFVRETLLLASVGEIEIEPSRDPEFHP